MLLVVLCRCCVRVLCKGAGGVVDEALGAVATFYVADAEHLGNFFYALGSSGERRDVDAGTAVSVGIWSFTDDEVVVTTRGDLGEVRDA